MFTVLIFFIVLSVLVIIHELGHFFAAKLQGIKVEEFGFGIPPRIFGIRFGETLYSLNLLPFGGFVRVFGEEEAQVEGRKLTAAEKKRSFAHKKPWQKAIVLVAGVVLNFVLGWVIVSYLFIQGVPTPTDTVHIEEIAADSPADFAGLKADDVIEAVIVDSVRTDVDETQDIATLSQENAGEEITLVIRRGEDPFKTAIIPRANPPEGEGSLGIVITNFEIKQYSLVEAPVKGLIESARMTGLIGRELGKTLFRFVTFQEQEAEIAGPVGIARLTGQAAAQGIDALLQLVGLLSLNLAVINILPFPALDGGRLVFVIYEWITKRKVNAQIEQRLNFAGFALLISLLIFVTISDIIKLFN